MNDNQALVLILVLMEDALQVFLVKQVLHGGFCLNPCSNGRCSARGWQEIVTSSACCLNPCSNGRCSASL